jgi:hypothetical protein
LPAGFQLGRAAFDVIVLVSLIEFSCVWGTLSGDLNNFFMS